MIENSTQNTPIVPKVEKKLIVEQIVEKQNDSPVSDPQDNVVVKEVVEAKEEVSKPEIKEVVVVDVPVQEEPVIAQITIVEAEVEKSSEVTDSLELEFEKPAVEVKAEIEEIIVVLEPELQLKEELKPVIEVKEDVVEEPTLNIEKKTPVAESVMPSAPQSNNSDSQKIIADNFGGKSNSFNDGFEGAANNDISSKLQQKPIADLTKGVGLNDRFMFTRELFGGKSVKYDSVIAFVNHATSFAEATEYLKNECKLNFDDENVKYFVSLVARRHM